MRFDILQSWTTLNAGLKKLTLRELQNCLDVEIHGARRVNILNRLQGRICRLERAERFKELRRKLK